MAVDVANVAEKPNFDLDLALFIIDTQGLTFLLAICSLNIFVFWVLRRLSLTITLTEVLSEKDPAVVKEQTQLVHELNVREKLLVDKGVKTETEVDPGASTEVNLGSFSRMAGVLGSLVLVATLWALGNFLIWASFYDRLAVKPVLEQAGDFFLAGSALFAPYAFNQLGSIFRSGNAGAGARR
jgi:hypothetical protein